MEERLNTNEDFTLKELVLVLREWIFFLLSKFRILLLGGLLGAVLGIAYSMVKKPLYVAHLTFALEDDKQSGIGGALGLAGQFGLDLGGGSSSGVFSGSNLIELFKSRSMVEKTLLSPITREGKTTSLAEMYIEENKWREDWEKNEKFKNIRFLPNANREIFTRSQDSILEVIYNDLSTTGLSVSQVDKKTGIILVEVKSTNEIFSKAFTESIATVVCDFYVKTKSEKAKLNMEILQHQLDSIRRELNNSLEGVAVANDKTFGLNPALNVKRVPSARRQVDVQTNSATLGELVKQTELAKVTVRKETPLIQIIDMPIYPLKKEKVGKIKAGLTGGFIAVFFIVLFLVVKRMYNGIMSNSVTNKL